MTHIIYLQFFRSIREKTKAHTRLILFLILPLPIVYASLPGILLILVDNKFNDWVRSGTFYLTLLSLLALTNFLMHDVLLKQNRQFLNYLTIPKRRQVFHFFLCCLISGLPLLIPASLTTTAVFLKHNSAFESFAILYFWLSVFSVFLTLSLTARLSILSTIIIMIGFYTMITIKTNGIQYLFLTIPIASFALTLFFGLSNNDSNKKNKKKYQAPLKHHTVLRSLSLNKKLSFFDLSFILFKHDRLSIFLILCLGIIILIEDYFRSHLTFFTDAAIVLTLLIAINLAVHYYRRFIELFEDEVKITNLFCAKPKIVENQIVTLYVISLLSPTMTFFATVSFFFIQKIILILATYLAFFIGVYLAHRKNPDVYVFVNTFALLAYFAQWLLFNG